MSFKRKTIPLYLFCTGVKRLLFTVALLIFSFIQLHAQQLYMKQGSYLVTKGAAHVVIHNASLKNNGTFVSGSGTVTFAGNADTTVSYLTGSSSTVFNNITVSKSSYGVALKSYAGVRNILRMMEGKMYTDSNLTLLSDASNTAMVATVPASCDIVGKATVERYFPAKRSWRLITGPVRNSNTIYNTWQNRGTYTVGRGMLISNPVVANGIDTNTSSSLKRWNSASQALVNVTNTYTSLSSGNTGNADNTGYLAFVRGDRNPATIGLSYCNNTTLSSIGELQIGNQTFTVSSIGNNYSLIGNPYASPVDFNSIALSNVVRRMYVWDPQLNSVGGYVMLDDIDGDGTYSKTVLSCSQNNVIQSGQAFFVQTIANGSATVTFRETDKSTTNMASMFRPLSPAGRFENMRVNLYLPQQDNSVVVGDGTIADFNDAFDPGINLAQDAIKFGNTNEGVAFARNGTVLAAERRPIIGTSNDTMFLRLTKITQRNYRFEIISQNLDHPGLLGFLEDTYLGTQTPINLSGATQVDFNVDANAGSSKTDRFRIIFRQAILLPVTFTTVKAYLQNKDVAVEWKVENEIDMSSYDIERSSDGTSFTKVGNVRAAANGGSITYTWLDKHPLNSSNFYRIRSIARNGDIKYSRVVKISFAVNLPSITVYPNPVENNVINLLFNNKPEGNYTVRLLNDAGQQLYSNCIHVNGNGYRESIQLTGKYPTGIYQLEFYGPGNDRLVQKIQIR